jgi:predicted regulator of Ras-like GTPase activity (Roadblock/LC7/MglB family)
MRRGQRLDNMHLASDPPNKPELRMSPDDADNTANKEKATVRPHFSLIISETDSKRIRQQLDRVLAEAGATSTLLLDRGGEVISARGTELPSDLDVLGALLAGTFATSREVARMMNDKEFRTLVQQGMKENTLAEMVGESWIVVVMFDKSTHLGLVKDLCRRITPELEAVLLQVQRRSRSMTGLNPAFRTQIEDTIDLLFKD